MKKQYFVFFALIVAVLAAGCASSAPQQQQGVSNSDVPDFVKTTPVQEDALFGVGTANLSSENQSLTMAESRARQSVARQISTMAQEMITDYSREAGTQNNTASLEFAETVGRQLSQAKLNGATVVKREKTSNGAWWALVSYSKADAVKVAADAAKGVIENEASRYAEFKAMDALKMMDAQFAKNKTVPEVVSE